MTRKWNAARFNQTLTHGEQYGPGITVVRQRFLPSGTATGRSFGPQKPGGALSCWFFGCTREKKGKECRG